MPNIHCEPFEDVEMAKKWGECSPSYIFVPLTHLLANIIVNNWELDLMGWKYDEKYMLVPKSIVVEINKQLEQQVNKQLEQEVNSV